MGEIRVSVGYNDVILYEICLEHVIVPKWAKNSLECGLCVGHFMWYSCGMHVALNGPKESYLCPVLYGQYHMWPVRILGLMSDRSTHESMGSKSSYVRCA